MQSLQRLCTHPAEPDPELRDWRNNETVEVAHDSVMFERLTLLELCGVQLLIRPGTPFLARKAKHNDSADDQARTDASHAFR